MKPLIGTSWKMNLTPDEAVTWFRTVVALAADIDDRELFVLPPFPALAAARDELTGSRLAWGAQDVHELDAGAHTGDVSAPMLVALGCRYAEIGHSERRRDHAETNARVAAKVRAAVRWGLTPILCVGERHRRPAPAARPIVLRQLAGSLAGVPAAGLSSVVVAYEPVWAIGAGATAAPVEHVVAVHDAIRGWLRRRGVAAPRVIYGGSVDDRNAARLLAEPAVDGLFVGRAALDPAVFAAIARTPIGKEEVAA